MMTDKQLDINSNISIRLYDDDRQATWHKFNITIRLYDDDKQLDINSNITIRLCDDDKQLDIKSNITIRLYDDGRQAAWHKFKHYYTLVRWWQTSNLT
jgi:hypothetical protein